MKMLKTKAFLTLCVLCLGTSLLAQDPQFEWAVAMSGADNVYSESVAVNSDGFVYITGYFQGTVDFDPGSGSQLLTSNGSYDIYLVKLDSLGNFVYVNQIGGISSDHAREVKIGSNGEVLITGYYYGTVDFDPGSGIYNLYLGGGFVAKYDSLGNIIWAKSIGGQGISLTSDNSGNIYIIGSFYQLADFNPDSLISYYLFSNGYSDIFILKLNSVGDFVWAISQGGYADDQGSSIALDKAGNVLSTGNFYGSGDFDPGPNTHTLVSNGDFDIFISKLDSLGNFVWAKNVGSGSYYEWGNSIALDDMGNPHVLGQYYGLADFDPDSIGVLNIYSAGEDDIFLLKLDYNGNLVWTKSFGGTSVDGGESIAIDEQGNMYISGYFNGIADFDPGPGVYNLTSAGHSEVFMCKLDFMGNLIWAKSIEGNSTDKNMCLAIDMSENIFITGHYKSTADFNPGVGIFNQSSAGDYDAYILKLSQCNQTTSTISETSCGYYISPSGNFIWNTSGIYNDAIFNAAGCDSVITIDLTIIELDTSVTQNLNTLTANAIGATYQWIECSNGYTQISGATNQSFTPTINGSYAVVVTENGCTDTSECYTISLIVMKENNYSSRIKIYPLPAKDKLYIDFGKTTVDGELEIINSIGQILLIEKFIQQKEIELDIRHFPVGEYVTKISFADKTVVAKQFIKQ
ncbi:MAG: T9SS type A sorting domain-containing protein [Bacteroidetes bacterium]|nr:T9SS type A sorting domain-containing protein [Bacteroidota bacterium]